MRLSDFIALSAGILAAALSAAVLGRAIGAWLGAIR